MGKIKKVKVKKESRDEKAKRQLAERIRERENNSLTNMRIASKKNDYIKNIINGRYFLSRVNMIADQMNSGDIKEKIDGCQKSMDLMKTEYALMKLQAITSMRNAHFAKKDLFEGFKFTEKDIEELEKDYYDGKIVRESYDDEHYKGSKAKFVKEESEK